MEKINIRDLLVEEALKNPSTWHSIKYKTAIWKTISIVHIADYYIDGGDIIKEIE